MQAKCALGPTLLIRHEDGHDFYVFLSVPAVQSMISLVRVSSCTNALLCHRNMQ